MEIWRMMVSIVLVLILLKVIINIVIGYHQHLLVMTIFVSLETMASVWEGVRYFLKMILYGMGSSVRVNAAAALEILHHGSM